MSKNSFQKLDSPLQRHRSTCLPKTLSVACTTALVAYTLILPAFAKSTEVALNQGETNETVIIRWIDAAHLPRSNVGSYIFRIIGWTLIKALRMLVNGVQSVVTKITGNMGNLFGSANDPSTWGKGVFSGTYQTIILVFLGLLAVVIGYIGITYMLKPQKIGTLARNIAIGIVLAVSLPFFVGGGFHLTNQFISAIPGSRTPIGDQLLMTNVYDVLNLDNADTLNQIAADPATFSSLGKLGQLKAAGELAPINRTKSATEKENFFNQVDITETVGLAGWWGNDATTEDGFWNNRVVRDKNGNESLQALSDGRIGNDGKSGNILGNQYYRYDVDWAILFVSLIAMSFALVLCGIKLVRLIFELSVKQLLGQILAFLDIHTMQRLKKCLYSILGTLASIFGISLMLQLYVAAQSQIATWSGTGSAFGNVFANIIIQIALAWMVIDGPDIFERIFGIDIGVKSALGTMYGLQSAGRAVGAVGKSIFGARTPDGSGRVGGLFGQHGVSDKVSGAVSTAAGAAGAAGGFAAGAVAGSRAGIPHNGNGGGDAPAAQSAATATDSNQSANSAEKKARKDFQSATAHRESPQTGFAVAGSRAGIPHNGNGGVAAGNGGGDAPATGFADAQKNVHQAKNGGAVPDNAEDGPATVESADEKPDRFATDDFAAAEYERQQMRGYGETTGEYLHSRAANAQKAFLNSRFAKPARMTKRAYNLAKNSAINHRVDKS
ncbi:MAG: hypothetical protein LKE53_06450 [Oscillospiraceae bacterium]|jgi:hypothetical protein|nr:hypothetical protein [Oscillospiraceae bacterium]